MMKYLAIFLGLISGKWNVMCDSCANLDSQGMCYGHKMPDDVIHSKMMCGFWKKRASTA